MATSNLSSNAIRILTLPAAVIGIVQGAVWLGLSLTAILVYNEVIEITNPTVYEDLICNIYLRYNMIFIDIFLVNSKVFNIIMYFYLVLSFIWLIISAYMLWAVVRRKWNYTIHVLICWSTVTILLSLIDISFMSVLAADLQKAQDIFASAMIPTTPTITAVSSSSPSTTNFDLPTSIHSLSNVTTNVSTSSVITILLPTMTTTHVSNIAKLTPIISKKLSISLTPNTTFIAASSFIKPFVNFVNSTSFKNTVRSSSAKSKILYKSNPDSVLFYDLNKPDFFMTNETESNINNFTSNRNILANSRDDTKFSSNTKPNRTSISTILSSSTSKSITTTTKTLFPLFSTLNKPFNILTKFIYHPIEINGNAWTNLTSSDRTNRIYLNKRSLNFIARRPNFGSFSAPFTTNELNLRDSSFGDGTSMTKNNYMLTSSYNRNASLIKFFEFIPYVFGTYSGYLTNSSRSTYPTSSTTNVAQSNSISPNSSSNINPSASSMFNSELDTLSVIPIDFSFDETSLSTDSSSNFFANNKEDLLFDNSNLPSSANSGTSASSLEFSSYNFPVTNRSRAIPLTDPINYNDFAAINKSDILVTANPKNIDESTTIIFSPFIRRTNRQYLYNLLSANAVTTSMLNIYSDSLTSSTSPLSSFRENLETFNSSRETNSDVDSSSTFTSIFDSATNSNRTFTNFSFKNISQFFPSLIWSSYNSTVHPLITPDVPSAVYSFDVPIEPVDLLDENVPIGPIQQFANLLVTTTPHAILKNRIITATKQDVYTAIGIVMSIAARGYILWIVNVIFAVILVVQVLKFRSNMSLSWMERPIINAYGNGQKPFSLYDNVPIDKSFQNEGFVSDVLTGPSDNLQNNNRNPLSNSNRSSLVYGQTPTYPLDYNKPTIIIPSAQSDGKLAKIGRAGGTRSPPRNVPSPTVPHSSNMPYIPEPDYTPPGSPKPKGVLRPGSKYEY